MGNKLQHKVCTRCDKRKHVSEFGRYSFCNNCQKLARADSMRKYQYGLTPGEYKLLLLAQDYKCAICRKPRRLVVDHDHATGKVRGLLCGTCNTAIGHFKDDPELLRQGIAYLDGAKGS